MKQELTAIDHIAKNGLNSRTNMFNGVMASVTAFAVPMLALVPEAHDWANVAVPSTLTLVTTLGNTLLYGATHVKHSSDRK